MNRFHGLLAVSLVAAVALLVPAPARAGLDVSFGINAPLGNDGNLFFSISSRYFDRDPHVVMDWSRQFPDPDDLAVFLHICSHSRVAPDVIYRYRRSGLPWYEVGVRAGIPVETWYVPVLRDPGPPYGRAYGHWRKHQRDPHYAVRLTDREARDLVAVRMCHEYYGVSPEVAMDWRRGGADVRSIMTREYNTRHGDDHRGGGRGHARDDDQDEHRGEGHRRNGHGEHRGH